jgi:hypothetical protein
LCKNFAPVQKRGVNRLWISDEALYKVDSSKFHNQQKDITMEPTTETTTPQPDSLGLAIASLVLGIISVTLSFLVLGGVLGLVGSVLGWVHLAKGRRPTGMARWGTTLSAIGVAASIGFCLFYYSSYKSYKAAMESNAPSQGSDLTADRKCVV